MRTLFIDDEKIRFDIFQRRLHGRLPSKFQEETYPLDYASNSQEALLLLVAHCNNPYDVISFDYDIYDPNVKEWRNTVHVAEWFVENCPKDKIPKYIVIHSINPQGAWHLFHILCKLTKVFMCPFRLENAQEYLWAAEML